MTLEEPQNKSISQALRELVGADSLVRAFEKTGVSGEYIRVIMRGGRRPSYDIIKKIAKGYGVPPDDLLRAADYTETMPEPSEVRAPPAEYVTFSADATNERIERLEKEVSGLRADLDRIVGMFRNMAGIVKGRVGEKEQEDRHG